MKPIPPTPSQLRALAIRDPALGHVMKSTPPFPSHPVGRYSHFHSLSRAVISQQLAGKAANAIYGRVKALVPGPAFPTPARFLELSDEGLRGAGLSKAKTRAIRDLAGRVESGKLKLRSIGRQPDVEVIRRLTEVWGIGEWSAQMQHLPGANTDPDPTFVIDLTCQPLGQCSSPRRHSKELTGATTRIATAGRSTREGSFGDDLPEGAFSREPFFLPIYSHRRTDQQQATVALAHCLGSPHPTVVPGGDGGWGDSCGPGMRPGTGEPPTASAVSP